MASPLIGVSGQAAAQVRALERSLGLDASKVAAAEDAAHARRGTKASADLLTAREIAGAFGCNIRTIAKWTDEGMPVAERGKGGRPSLFNLKDAEHWKSSRDFVPADGVSAQPLAARMRKENAQAAEAEQRVAMRAGELVNAKDIEQRIAHDYARCRTKLLGLPRKVKAALPHLSVADVKVMDMLVREALESLAGSE